METNEGSEDEGRKSGGESSSGERRSRGESSSGERRSCKGGDAGSDGEVGSCGSYARFNYSDDDEVDVMNASDVEMTDCDTSRQALRSPNNCGVFENHHKLLTHSSTTKNHPNETAQNKIEKNIENETAIETKVKMESSGLYGDDQNAFVKSWLSDSPQLQTSQKWPYGLFFNKFKSTSKCSV